MKNRKKVLLMALILAPLVALSSWLIYAGHAIPGGIIFALSIVAGNWYIWRIAYRKPKMEAKVNGL